MPSAVELVNQFMLSRSDRPIPEGWLSDRRGGWTLSRHPRLPMIEARAPGGAPIGWIVGHPIDEDGRIVESAYTLAGSVEEWGADPEAVLNRTVNTLAGRYVLFSVGGPAPRVYLDPCASLAAVFSAAGQIVASTSTLAVSSGRVAPDLFPNKVVRFVENDGWFPFGLTHHPDVERLISNHYLDLSTWRSKRYWPAAQDLDPDVEPESAILEVGERIARNISAVAQKYPLHLPLTAGRDSRVLLACSRSLLDRATLFTIDLPDEQGRLDRLVASRLARRLNLPHRVLHWEEATERDRFEWLIRTGGAVGGRAMRAIRTLNQLDAHRCVMTGFGVDLGRFGGSKRFREGSREVSRDVMISAVLERVGLAESLPEVRKRARMWVDDIADLPPAVAYCLYWLEQRVGCWGTPQEYGMVQPQFVLYPVSDRRIIQLLLSLPVASRTREGFARTLIGRRWPELLQLPFNKPLGVARYVSALQRRYRALTAGSLLRAR